MKISQKERIIEYIRKYGSITDMEANNDLGIRQFGARLYELKNDDGYKFKSKWEQSKNRFGEVVAYKRYYLDDQVEQNKQHIPVIF